MEKAKNYATMKVFFLFFLALTLSVASAFAVSDPPGCSSTSVTLALAVYEEDGVTPVVTTVVSGQTLKYEARLQHSGGTACNYEGGSLFIRTPDGVEHNVTPNGGVPLVEMGSDFVSDMVSYVVAEVDVVNVIQLRARATYGNGTSLFLSGVTPVGATTPTVSFFEAQELEVSKDATPHYIETYNWDITKTADPEVHSLFDGQSGTSDWTVSVTKSGPVESGWNVTGTIFITNPSEFVDAVITDVSDVLTGAINAVVDCGVSFPYNLAPLDTLECTYYADLPDSTDRVNTVTVSTSGDIDGGSAIADVLFNGPDTVVDDTIDVTDTNGQSWQTSSSDSWTYNEVFDCSQVEYSEGSASYNRLNVATITQTGQSANATVDVTCYQLSAEKNAATSLTRTYSWEITKSVDPASHNLFEDDSGVSTWTVSVDQTGSEDSAWFVTGNITVTNPAPMVSPTVTVTDSISGFGDVSVTCPEDTVPANGELVCSYSAALGDGTTRTNTATVTYEEFEAAQAQASVDFTSAAVTEVLPSVTVTDTNGMSWEAFGDDEWTYDQEFDCTDVEYVEGLGGYTHDNTATIVETQQSDDASVDVVCSQLIVNKDASTSLTRTHEWTIEKVVDLDTHMLFDGQSGTSDYDVTVTKTGFTDSDWAAAGTITVYNPDNVAVMIDSVVDELTGGVFADVVCDQTLPYDLQPDETLTCTYSVDLDAGDNLVNTVTVFRGEDAVGTAQADVDFSQATVTDVNDEVTVDDSVVGVLGTTSTTQTFEYSRDFDCAAVEYVDGVGGYSSPNVATIVETEQSDDANVDVTCYQPSVSKTVEETFEREFFWDITKTVDPETVDIFDGQNANVDWLVEVTQASSQDTEHAVSGVITIVNPNPSAALPLSSVIDELNLDGELVGVDCSGAVEVPADDSIDCTYSGNAPSGNQTNIATANFGAGINPVSSAPVDVVFDTPTTLVNDVVTVTDDNQGELGTTTTSTTFPYTLNYDCADVQYSAGFATYTVPNTATIEETDQQDDATLTVNCYLPSISKTVDADYTRSYEWTIEKTVSADLALFDGQSGNADWEIQLTKSEPTDGNFTVSGTITVVNPHPTEAAPLDSVTDDLSVDGNLAVDCSGATEVPANSFIECTYSGNAPSGDQDNTATVTFLDGITGDDTTEPVTFGDPSTIFDDEVTVVDDNGLGPFGPFTGSDLIEYTTQHACDAVEYVDGEGSYPVPNTAEIVETEQSDDATLTVTCYQLAIEKDATTSLTRTHEWSIEKTVDVDTHNLFNGDSGTSNYDVTVTKTGFTDSAWAVEGTITVSNPAPMDALAVTVIDDMSGFGAVAVSCPSSTVPANGELVCTYSTALGNGTTRTNTATGFRDGEEFGSADASVDFSLATVTDVNNEITVEDSVEGFLGTTSTTETYEYSQEFDCSEVELQEGTGQYSVPNIATITETGQNDNANVAVFCSELIVTKDASTSLTRTHEWTIEKVVDLDTHMLFDGQSGTSDYDVTVTKTGFTDSDWAVAGTISIFNPGVATVSLGSVTDEMTGNLVANVDCGVVFPYDLVGGDTLECTYDRSLPDASTLTNVVTVTRDNQDVVGTAQAEVNFADATVTDVNDEVTVDDSVVGVLGTTSTTQTFEYSRDFDCAAVEYVDGVGGYSSPNVATIVETEQSDDANVDVTCYQLDIEKNAATSLTRTYSWDVTKTVDPDAHDLFNGDSGVSTWTVTVTQTGSEDSAWFAEGNITVSNPAPMDALAVTVIDDMSGFGAVAVSCPSSTVPANGELVCTYSTALGDGTTRTNTATGFRDGEEFGSADASVDFTSAAVTEVLPSVTVTDTNGMSWEAFGDDEWTYDQEFDCSEVELEEGTGGYTHDNTATIVETQQSDDASVEVRCSELIVSKNAVTNLTRTYEWEITKDATPSSLDLFDGDSASSEYTVSVAQTGFTDSDWGVTGVISIYNPGTVVVLGGLTDEMTGGIFADYDCGVGFPYALQPEETLECEYNSELPDATTRTNTVTVLRDNQEVIGTAQAEVSFASATITPVNDEITIVDTNGMNWSTNTDDSFQYEQEFDCAAVEYTDGVGGYTHDNTATIVETQQSDDVSVDVTCYQLSIDKNAYTTLHETYDWEITKSVDNEEINLFNGDVGSATYTVTVTKTGPTHSDWAVEGNVTVSNPAPMDAENVVVADNMTGYGAVELNCPSSIVPANGELVCSYSTSLPDGVTRTNFAAATRDGNYIGGAQVDVDFTNAEVVQTNLDEIDVVDTNGMNWTTSTSDSWQYQEEFTCDDVELEESVGEYTHPNTATIVQTQDSDDASVHVTCGELIVDKTADTSLTRTYTWDIEKTVTPESWELFDGETATSEYTVRVTQNSPTDSEWSAFGTVSITNPTQVTVVLDDVVDTMTTHGVVSLDCGVAFPYNLVAGDTLECMYDESLASGDDDFNTVEVYRNQVLIGSATADVLFGDATVTAVNEEITVVDTNGEQWDFNGSGSVMYEEDFDCSSVLYETGVGSYTHNNVATIVETDQSDNASVAVTCYQVGVEKTAETTYDRAYEWHITKMSETTELLLSQGQAHDVTYVVDVSVIGQEDSNWAVSGTITLNNPHPTRAAEIVSVTDVFGALNISVDCNATEIPAASSVECSYSSNLTSDATGQNTATVETQNYNFAANGIATPADTSEYSGQAAVTFGEPANEIDASVDVEDSFVGFLGTVTVDDSPQTFIYEYTFGPYNSSDCGELLVNNTASFVTSDTQTTGNATHSIPVTVECENGCTLTQGYWKTHSAQGPAPYDPRWGAIGDFDNDGVEEEEGETFFLATKGKHDDEASWYDVFKKSPKGNAYYILAHQYMAAKLNVLNGASSTPDVDGAILAAEELFALYTPDDLKKPKNDNDWNSTPSDNAKYYAAILVAYNEGLIGPGHCDETPACEDCACEGGMTEFTVEYTGEDGVDIEVFTDKDGEDLWTTFENVQSGDVLVVSATGLKDDKFKSRTNLGIGDELVEIHTSCSQVILGKTFGDFTVLGHVDRESNVCSVTDEPEPSACEEPEPDCPLCEGGMKVLTVQYVGPENGIVDVYADDKEEDLLASFTNVQPGDNLTITGDGLKDDKLKSRTYYIVNGVETEIHTSCSQEVLGQRFGDLLVIGHTDREENMCGYEGEIPPPEDVCQTCEDKMQWLTVQYIGSDNATVEVFDEKSEDLIASFVDVQSGDNLTVYGTGLKNDKLGTRTLFVANGEEVEIHTSCSQEIVGETFGDFFVLGHLDGEGNMCFLGQEVPLPPEVLPAQCQTCEDKIQWMTVRYLGAGNVTVDVVNEKDDVLIASFVNVQTDDVLLVNASELEKERLGTRTLFNVGASSTEIHTSCSQEIIGETFGDFLVLGHLDGDGNLCELDLASFE